MRRATTAGFPSAHAPTAGPPPRHAQRKSADFGIDGWTFLEENPVQVKRSEKVGRPEVQKFSSAVRAAKKQKGLMVAFSFSAPAYEEAARLKGEENVEIELETVQEVLL